ncbi:MAG TPA: hypothetical protein VJ866_22555 [Pyrinomonadaceae bacterium]|nr:hypothetical protein [Pyrinomonadaceae bacterium]
MSVTQNLSVGYHQQDTDYYCGAACAQMVLDEIGAGILDQDDLYADNHSHSTTDVGVNWATGPDGLTWTLNDRRPASFSNYFVLFQPTNEDTISRKIVWTIYHYQVAPVALVFGWAHWIVVRGYQTSAHPASSGDTAYTIEAFDVNNPWPPTPSPAPPPPHTSGDVCGSGGDRGIANEHISYSTWQSTYMTGVPGGYWAGKFLAVCDPEPPPDRVGQSPRPPRRERGDRLITPRTASKLALAGLDSYKLAEREGWRKALSNVSPGEPLLVQRLDHPDSFYYIVPMQSGQKRAPVLVSVDARFGDYRQSVLVPDGGASPLLAAQQNRKAVFERVMDTRLEFEDRRGRLLLRKEAVCLHPTLVWRPCRESLSPFWPFYMLTTATHRIYIRVDGAVFTALHDEPGI